LFYETRSKTKSVHNTSQHNLTTMSGTTYRGPINPNPKDGEASIIIYGYVPSLGLAITGVVTFALILLINAFYLIKKRGKTYRSFHILLLVGSVSHIH